MRIYVAHIDYEGGQAAFTTLEKAVAAAEASDWADTVYAWDLDPEDGTAFDWIPPLWVRGKGLTQDGLSELGGTPDHPTLCLCRKCPNRPDPYGINRTWSGVGPEPGP